MSIEEKVNRLVECVESNDNATIVFGGETMDGNTLIEENLYVRVNSFPFANFIMYETFGKDIDEAIELCKKKTNKICTPK